MKKHIYIFCFCVSLFAIVAFNNHHSTYLNTTPANFVAHKLYPIDKEKLEGEGQFKILTEDTHYNNLHVAHIYLTANSYFNWQSLPGGRVIIVTEGEGYYQSKGKSVVKIKKGDTIETTPGLYHWVGSAKSSKLEFISITSKKNNNLINWHEPVSNNEYKNAFNQK